MYFEMEQVIEEIWKPCIHDSNYLISNLGRVKAKQKKVWCKVNNSYSIRKERILKQTNCNTKKYWRIGLGPKPRKVYSVHRLVAECFIPNPNNFPQVNHIDGDRNNNSASNLEWCTQSENIQHSWKIGLRNNEILSRNCSCRKLTEEQVIYIKNEYKKVDTSIRGEKSKFYKEMQVKFNLKSPNTIGWIVKGGTNKFFN